MVARTADQKEAGLPEFCLFRSQTADCGVGTRPNINVLCVCRDTWVATEMDCALTTHYKRLSGLVCFVIGYIPLTKCKWLCPLGLLSGTSYDLACSVMSLS